MRIIIPNTEEYGMKLRKVKKRLEILDGWYETTERVFDPTPEDMERRIKFCIDAKLKAGLPLFN